MKVKICGITDLLSARIAVQYNVDALGFVFAESKRRITVKTAKKIISHIPKRIMKVGVFVDEEAENIQGIIDEVGLTAIQLHGEESPSFCSEFSIPVIKAFSIRNKENLIRVKEYNCPYILVDSPKGKHAGGTGLSFDWSLLKDLELKDQSLILAGGLTVDNVQKAISSVAPIMVDVSSGVETKGSKDINKIQQFLLRVKGGPNEYEQL